MYTLVSALVKQASPANRWQSAEIGDLSFQSLYSDYTGVIAVLSNPFLPNNVALDLNSVRTLVIDYQETFNAFLTRMGNKTLPTYTPVPSLTPKYARYSDAFKAGYKVQPVGPTQSPDAQLPNGAKTWLYLTKPNVDFRDFYRYCLVSVNGFLHRTDADQNGAWVVDGMKTARLANRNELGIINFQGVSTLSFIPVTADMIFKQSSDQAYRNQMRIDLGVDTTGKTLMASLGGYLHVLDQSTIRRISPTEVLIDFNNLPLWERYHESRGVIDYSSLPFQRTTNNESQFAIDDFMSDANLVAYMQLSQTFFILADNPELYKETVYIPNTKITGLLIAYTKPDKPLINGIGKLADYWARYEDGQWAVAVVDNYWHHRVYNTAPKSSLNNIADNREPTDPVSHSRGYFLHIGTDFAYHPPA